MLGWPSSRWRKGELSIVRSLSQVYSPASLERRELPLAHLTPPTEAEAAKSHQMIRPFLAQNH